ncbi:MAG: diaminopimelate decarboxylase [Ruminococcaceae bacterium]|nr:diaminopimelate decarboxylase [Oscillospiraceae bacterium]
MICNNIGVNEKGNLTFAGQDVCELARKYGTPLYLMDEEKIRENCRTYKNAMDAHFESALPVYASKAACFMRMYEIINEEGLGIDVVSVGEIYTAMKAGMSLENAYFHSNNKTDYDVEFAIENGVGYFVVDNEEELYAIERINKGNAAKQKVLLRLTPGIDTHTYEAVNTGKVDSKFGSAIETGQAEEITRLALEMEDIELMGFHCHIGSQVFDSDTFLRGSEIMLRFAAEMKAKYGYELKELSLGGGYGVKYVESEPEIDIAANIKQVSEYVHNLCAELGLQVPKMIMEPGRSIVADAGMTLYSVGTIKQIPGYKNYISIDGGMTDNPRYALYGSEYTLFVANRATEPADFTADVVGRCCESGDIIQPDVTLPKPVRGDIVAVCTTGAYNYSMASNYNRIARPAVVMLNEGKSYQAVKRESLDDLIMNDL